MPKSQYVDPGKVFEPGYIDFDSIPLCRYNKTIEEEKQLYSKADFLRIYHDMRTIREFETMLNEIKVKSEYNGVKYNNPGPAHLSIGQEASAVGQAYCMDINDFQFGSHRSHGEILAKGLSSINKLTDEELYDIMKEFLGGTILKVVEGKQAKPGDVKDLAKDFLLYGALAEIFARTTGFNKGLGGSMHAFFIPFGIFPNNAIVGGAAPIALGAALYKRANHKKGIVVANSGDGALGRGPVLESLNFASMDQITKLWGMGGKYSDEGMPILFNVFNNFYGMGGQTMGETMGFTNPARLAAGFTPTQMHAEKVNGYDPLAVIDATARKKELLLNGQGPAFLEVATYRVSGHSPSDSSTYRTPEEIEAWKAADPIPAYRNKLIAGGIADEAEFAAIDEEIVNRTVKIIKLAIDDEISPRMDLSKDPEMISSIMYSNQHVKSMDETREPEVLIPKEEDPRVKQIAGKARYAFDDKGEMIPKMKLYNIRDGLFEAIID
ncbi:MAG: thiamine pyrophosphate-dependent dehydrogenase E1 component subunit alpha, partial [Clostridia bacterium]|nr:thiamine pyrophosphate-dependent dehydrogenase E1 component subunit alpha [Clostridia bacterium]